MSARVRKGDEVEVISGKDVGVRGRVLEVNPRRQRVLVEGVNRVTRHEKIRPAQGRAGQEGGIVHKEAPIHLSNVVPVCGNCGGTRVRYRIDSQSGEKTRVCSKCGSEL